MPLRRSHPSMLWSLQQAGPTTGYRPNREDWITEQSRKVREEGHTDARGRRREAWDQKRLGERVPVEIRVVEDYFSLVKVVE